MFLLVLFTILWGLSQLENMGYIRLFQKLLPAPEGFNGCFSSLRPNRPQSGSRELTPFLLTAADAIPLVLACYWRLLFYHINLQSFHYRQCLKEYNYIREFFCALFCKLRSQKTLKNCLKNSAPQRQDQKFMWFFIGFISNMERTKLSPKN